jgi:hypothetical protein
VDGIAGPTTVMALAELNAFMKSFKTGAFGTKLFIVMPLFFQCK